MLCASLMWPAGVSAAEKTAAAPADGPIAAPIKGHVGATVCAECHVAESDAWKKSQHSLAMQVAGAATVLGNFHDATFTYAGTTSTFHVRGGRYFVRTDGPDGKLADFEIRYTFGVAPLQQYLIALPGGRLQALSIAWDTRAKGQGGQRWFHLYPKDNLKAGDPLHWTGIDQNWNFMCAECHSADLRKNFDAEHDRYETRWSEINIACEACHGPGAGHVAWARAKKDGEMVGVGKGLGLELNERRDVTWIPDPATGTAHRSAERMTAREIGMCARCHGRGSRISDAYVFGASLLDSHRLTDLDADLYWTDGQMRGEVYNLGPFMQSRMQSQGVTCSDCHDPHSGTLRAPGNQLCTQCHQAAKFDAPAHTHHVAGTAGASCPACHMPTTTYMQVDPRHDHSLRIPRPDLSVKFGVPNACNSCHTAKTPQWAADTLVKWKGSIPVGFQNFADALHAGDVGAPGARDALVRIINDPAQPAIVRASAIDRLAPWLNPATLPSVAQALNDTDPGVRLAAAGAIGGSMPVPTRTQYLPRLLDDPVLSVRIEAAHGLAGEGEAALADASRKGFQKAIDEYVAVQNYNADRPEGHANLGNLYAARGDAARAAVEYRKAIDIDPAFLPAYSNLADVDRSLGADADAIEVLKRGIARVPRAAPLHHALGLAYVRQKRSDDALRELAEATKLAPDNARFAYVYAVALNDAGRTAEALSVLKMAQKKQPYDRELLFGLAYYSAAANNREEALRYVGKLREVEPDNAEYAAFAARLGATRN
jgi:predicted CXXCH cytochrome family protein